MRRAFGDAKALRVQRHGPRQRAVAQQAGADAGVAGVFHQHLVARVQQQPRDQVDRLLRARAHHHLRRIAADAARGPQPQRDGAAQIGVARRVQVLRAGAALAGAGLARQPVPQGERKRGHLGRANAKRARSRQRRAPARCRLGNELPTPRQASRRRHQPPHGRHVHRLRHIGAVAHAGLHVAFGLQALHGPQHGVARHAQAVRLRARRRQARARAQVALLDGAAQLLVHALAQIGTGG